MTDRQTGETRETRERKRQKKEKIPTCLGLNRQSISVEPGEKAGIADGNGTAQKAKDEKERKKERLNSWSIYIIIPFWFSFFSNMEVKESIVMGIRSVTQNTEFLHKLLFGVTQSFSWLPFCVFRRFGVRSRFLAQCYLLPPTKRSRPFRIRPVVTRGCTPDDINTHRAQHRWRFTWKVKRPGIKRNNQKFKRGHLQYTRALEGK